jgi:Response regulator containing CheY-like receiver, AAA-type ATPase, and DNA-binding domains
MGQAKDSETQTSERKSKVTSKILFVDDDPIMHRLYKTHVERAGYEWIGANGGREAIEATACVTPSLAIVDLMMPEMDGLSTVAELRKGEATKTMPVIVITGEQGYYGRRAEFADAGAAAFMMKPFGPKQLLETISRLLETSAAARA